MYINRETKPPLKSGLDSLHKGTMHIVNDTIKRGSGNILYSKRSSSQSSKGSSVTSKVHTHGRRAPVPYTTQRTDISEDLQQILRSGTTDLRDFEIEVGEGEPTGEGEEIEIIQQQQQQESEGEGEE
jgi:hypothetical protein